MPQWKLDISKGLGVRSWYDLEQTALAKIAAENREWDSTAVARFWGGDSPPRAQVRT